MLSHFIIMYPFTMNSFVFILFTSHYELISISWFYKNNSSYVEFFPEIFVMKDSRVKASLIRIE